MSLFNETIKPEEVYTFFSQNGTKYQLSNKGRSDWSQRRGNQIIEYLSFDKFDKNSPIDLAGKTAVNRSPLTLPKRTYCNIIV